MALERAVRDFLNLERRYQAALRAADEIRREPESVRVEMEACKRVASAVCPNLEVREKVDECIARTQARCDALQVLDASISRAVRDEIYDMYTRDRNEALRKIAGIIGVLPPV